MELMVGMLSAAILALAAGSMLVYTAHSWVRNSAMAELERDAAVANLKIEIAVRGASASNTVTGLNILRVLGAGATGSFTRTGNSLYYNSNGTTGGVVLINNRLDSRTGNPGFVSSYTNSPNSAFFITLNLFDPVSGVGMSFSNRCIRSRN